MGDYTDVLDYAQCVLQSQPSEVEIACVQGLRALAYYFFGDCSEAYDAVRSALVVGDTLRKRGCSTASDRQLKDFLPPDFLLQTIKVVSDPRALGFRKRDEPIRILLVNHADEPDDWLSILLRLQYFRVDEDIAAKAQDAVWRSGKSPLALRLYCKIIGEKNPTSEHLLGALSRHFVDVIAVSDSDYDLSHISDRRSKLDALVQVLDRNPAWLGGLFQAAELLSESLGHDEDVGWRDKYDRILELITARGSQGPEDFRLKNAKARLMAEELCLRKGEISESIFPGSFGCYGQRKIYAA